MTLISCFIVFNISIILLMIIAFSNITFVTQISAIELYQLADLKNLDYDEYLETNMKTYEKKMNIREYFRSKYNLQLVKFNFTVNTTWDNYLKNIKISCSEFPRMEYMVQDYFVTSFKKKIEKFRKCTSTMVKCSKTKKPKTEDKNNISGSKPSQSNNELENNISGSKPSQSNNEHSLLEIVYNSLTNNKPEDEVGCCGFLKKTTIEKIDKALKPTGYVEKFYGCFLYFKNEVLKMNIENANYPKTTDTTNKVGRLTKTEKQNLLQDRDIDLIRKAYDFNKFNKSWLTEYTGYDAKLVSNDGPEINHDCMRIMYDDTPENHLKFRLTRLSYRFIYPFQLDNIYLYKLRRKAIIKNLKILDNTFENNADNEILNILEKANNQVNENYFDMMKTCRALSNETTYDAYVMRLINTGCLPLGNTEWKRELKDTGNNDVIANMVLQHMKKIN